MNKYITGAIIGMCILATVYSVWSMLSLKSRVSELELFATKVAQLINNATQQPK
jgi:hypothetical protein